MTETPKSTCLHCGKAISLVPWGKHYKWVTANMGWHCGHDPLYPMRVHAPVNHSLMPDRTEGSE